MKKDFYSFEQWCIDNGHEDWLDLWDYELNDKRPSEVSYGSNKKYYFKCPRHIHESEPKQLHSLIQYNEILCKKCKSFGQYLLDTFGEDGIKIYWSGLNKISPFDIYAKSKTIVYMKCSNNLHPDYEIITENFVYGKRCPVCANKKIIYGINDIATTHPHLVKYFKDPEDTTKYSIGSQKKVWFVCPDCGRERYVRICTAFRYGYYSCPICGDCVSYANKFMYDFLKQLNDNIEFIFEPEKTFGWSKQITKDIFCRTYDFYIHSHENIIIEVHGSQHYEDNGFERLGGRSLKEEQENDKLKMDLAITNGILLQNYIVLDCRKSQKEWIKNSIMSSNLPKIFGFTENDINWNRCSEFACSSLVKLVCDMWNDGLRIKAIACELGLNKSTIAKYLKRGSEIGWCEYDIAWNTKPIMCVENGYVFASSKICSSMSSDIFGKSISQASIRSSACGYNQTASGYHFRYITRDEFKQYKILNANII